MLNRISNVAGMFSGYIQAGAVNSHPHGITGWRWIFIVDSLISAPISILGFYSLPDFPQNTRARWMTKKDRQFALARAKRYGRIKPIPVTFSGFFKAILNWKILLFLFPYFVTEIGNNYGNYFILWLQSLNRFTVQHINIIPTAQGGCAFLVTLLYACLSDILKNRILFMVLAPLIGFICCLILSIWNVSFGGLIFAFIGNGASSAQTVTFYDEPDLKGLNVAVGNTLVYAFSAFLPLAIFKTSDSPDFKNWL